MGAKTLNTLLSSGRFALVGVAPHQQQLLVGGVPSFMPHASAPASLATSPRDDASRRSAAAVPVGKAPDQARGAAPQPPRIETNVTASGRLQADDLVAKQEAAAGASTDNAAEGTAKSSDGQPAVGKGRQQVPGLDLNLVPEPQAGADWAAYNPVYGPSASPLPSPFSSEESAPNSPRAKSGAAAAAAAAAAQHNLGFAFGSAASRSSSDAQETPSLAPGQAGARAWDDAPSAAAEQQQGAPLETSSAGTVLTAGTQLSERHAATSLHLLPMHASICASETSQDGHLPFKRQQW